MSLLTTQPIANTLSASSTPADSRSTSAIGGNLTITTTGITVVQKEPQEVPPAVTRIPSLDVVSDGNASAASISGNGRYVAFSSTASTVVAEDNNGVSDVFVYNRNTKVTERISATASVAAENKAVENDDNAQPSYNPSISNSGRYIAFESILPSTGRTGSTSGIFVYDQNTGETEQVDLSSDGAVGNGSARGAKISKTGRFVTFSASAKNLVAGDTNNQNDIFIRDRARDTTKRISVGIKGTESNGDSDQAVISANDRFVAFTSYASNLVEDDTNDTGDVFVYDRRTKATERISINSAGEEGNGFSNTPSISANGRYVGYTSFASNLVEDDTNEVSDVFIYDRKTQTTERVSVDSFGDQSNGFSFNHSLSNNGRYVSYSSVADNLVGTDTNGKRDVFIYDRSKQVTQQISVNSDGVSGSGNSTESSLSANGRFAVFQSNADNLVSGDRNLRSDIFIFDRDAAPATSFAERTLDGLRPMGAEGQKAGRKFIDLTEATSPTMTATIEVSRNAGFDNTIGFYAIENDKGSVKDSVTGELLQPGDVGYVQAAIAQQIGPGLTGNNNKTTTYTAEWKTGTLFSTFIVSDGTIESLLDDNLLNDPAIFFSNIGANSDGQEHVRLLADNTFGYEDMIGGGDRDFNDMVVSLKFS